MWLSVPFGAAARFTGIRVVLHLPFSYLSWNFVTEGMGKGTDLNSKAESLAFIAVNQIIDLSRP